MPTSAAVMRRWRQANPERNVWVMMRQRCNNPNYTKYWLYGGRGITVCDAWSDFKAFFRDMGPRPGADYHIDRIDPNGNYEPTNCRWVHRVENSQRLRSNKLNMKKAREIRRLRQEGMRPKDIVRRFGISWGHFYNIIHERRWKEI